MSSSMYWGRKIQRRRVLRTGAGGVSALAALAIVGCGDDDDKPRTASPSASQATAATSAASASASAAATGAASTKRLPQVTVGLSADVAYTDGAYPVGAQDHIFSSHVYDTVVTIAPDNKMQANLATSWESPDTLTHVFKLRPNVKFHNGDAFTSDDIKFTIARHIGPGAKSSGVGNWANVDRIETPDPQTFRIIMKKHDINFVMGAFGQAGYYALPAKYFASVGDKDFAEKPVGTGAYRFDSRKIGDSWTLNRNPDYWGNGGPADKATFRVLPDGSSRFAALQTGAIDLMQSIPLPLLKELEGSKTLKLALTTRVIAPYFKITHEAPPAAIKAGANINPPAALKDKRVRQAMNFAVDRKAIAKTLFAGTAQESLWALPTDEWADPKWFSMYPYDANKAKALLKEAGVEGGFDLNVYTIIGERLPQIKESTEAVAAYLRAVGIRPQIKPIEYAQWLEMVFNSRPPWSDGLLFHWNNPAGLVNPIAGFQTNYWSGGATAMLNNPTHDDYYQKLVVAPTRPDVIKLLKEWGNFESDFVTNIYGWAFVTPWALRSDRISAKSLGDTDFFRMHDLTAV